MGPFKRPFLLSEWNHAPPYVRWLGWRYLLFACVFSSAAIAMAILKRPLGMRGVDWFKWATLGVGLVPLVAVMPICQWMLGRTRRKFEAARGRLCTHCGYDLTGLAPKGACPECGKSFEADRDAEAWRRVGFALPEGPDPSPSEATPSSLPVE
jgi:hypothetical protein